MSEPIKPLQQTTPVVQNDVDNFKSQSRGSSSTVNIINETLVITQSGGFNGDSVIEDGTGDPSIDNPGSGGGSGDPNLPDGFTFTVVPSSPAITVAADGTTTANVDVQIPDVNGIMDWEVRLVLNA